MADDLAAALIRELAAKLPEPLNPELVDAIARLVVELGSESRMSGANGDGVARAEDGGRLAPAAGRLLEAEDVARYLGMTTDWIYQEVRAGRLPHIRLGRYVRFRREAIEGWLMACERGNTLSAENDRTRDRKSRPRHRRSGSYVRYT